MPTSGLRRKTMTSPLREEPSAGPSVSEGTAALVVQDIVVGYGGGDVLRGVSLQVHQGGITCVVGPNGAGKSTLLGAISGLLRPRLGQISLHGDVLTGRSPRQILQMGVVQVPQNHSLFREMTVRENIVLGGYILRERGLPERRLDAVLEMFAQVTEWPREEGGQPVRWAAAPGRVCPLPDARPEAGYPGRAVDGPVPEGPQVRVRRGPDDEPAGQDGLAGGAERAGRAAAVHPRRGPGERAGPAGRHRPRSA